MGATEADAGATKLPRPDAVQMRARRSPKLIAGGVLAVVLGALGFAYIYESSTNYASVVAVAQPIARGSVVTQEQLRVVQVPEGFSTQTLAADALDDLVGRTALTDLPMGSFPLASHVGDNPLPGGEALVGLRLTHGQLPTAALPAGTAVELVGVGDAADASKVVPAVVATAPLLLDDGASFVVDVRVAHGEAGAVARLAARNELALFAVGER